MLTVILTGGMSRRMGRDKAMLPFEGGVMSESLIKKYAVLGPVAVSVNAAGRFPAFGALELEDAYPGQGPLNGLFSAFERTDADTVFLTGTDLPFGEPELALRLAGLLAGHDACVLRRGGRVEPLFGVYSRSCFPAVRSCLAEGRLSFAQLFSSLDVLYVGDDALSGLDAPLMLMNVNTPEEYENALKK